MRARLLQWLACPACGGADLRARDGGAGSHEIVDGVLACAACARTYPILEGVPRLLPDDLLAPVLRRHPSWLAAHPEFRDRFADGPERRGVLGRIQERYSFFHVRMLPPDDRERELREGRRSLFYFLPSLSPEFLGGKLGVDFGCGRGRHLRAAADLGAEMVGIDLSEGVEVAYDATRDLPRAHVVQGDIYHLPLRREVFDFGYSIGVLHHLPDSRRGFEQLASLVRPEGQVLAWVYGLEGMRWSYRLSHLRWIRPVAARLPRPLQVALAAIIAGLAELVVWRPAAVMSRISATAAWAERIPFGRGYEAPFRAKVRRVLDRIHPPITRYPTRGELAEWLGGLAEVRIETTERKGWSASGVKASA